MQITAKVHCNGKQEYNYSDQRYATLGFCPDYQAGRNQEWAASTPHLDLRMTVTGAVADQFELGKRYTLTFTADDDV